MVKGLSRAGAEAIVQARQGAFGTVQDLVFLSGINRKILRLWRQLMPCGSKRRSASSLLAGQRY